MFTKYRKVAYATMEHEILDFWRQNDVFKASVEQRSQENAYVFYDGPPFITGLPHHGTLLSFYYQGCCAAFSDDVWSTCRTALGLGLSWLASGKLRRGKLNLKDKKAVLDYGLEKYIIACRENMIQTGSLWEESINRVGRWVEFKNAYKTMDAPYMESVWWAFKKLYEKGLIYEGEKVLVYCTRCATPVSKAEVAMDNSYQMVSDPSVYAKFKLTSASSASFLDGIGFSRLEKSDSESFGLDDYALDSFS